MTLIPSFIVLCVFIFSLSSQAMPLSPESVKSLRAAGRLEAVVSRVNQARAKGVDAPGHNILKSLTGRKRGTPARDETILHVPVILVDFSDNEANENDYPLEHYDEILFSEGELDPGSMREWYAVNSYGEVDVVGVVVGWVRAPQTYEYYVDGQNGWGDYPQNVQRMVRDAASAADGDIDFSDFDNDGDGEVDNLVVVHAGPGAEVNDGNADMIWSHSWALGGYSVRLDGVWINRYTIQPEDGEIGVFGHELGHGLFGLPDLYDRDYSSEGLGEWSMMAGGSWGGGGASPTHFDAWCKYQIGFIAPTVLDGDSAGIEIPPVEDGDATYILWTRGRFRNEYFIVENRQQIGFDESLPGSGLLIYHIDDDVLDQNDNEWYPGHEDEGHYLVALEQADGDWDLEQNNSRGDGGDPWPGDADNETLDAESTPDSRDYEGNDTEVAVRNIASDGENITCDFEVRAQGGAAPDIVVDADLLDFGEVSIGDSTNQTLTISNVGDADLTITDIGIDPNGIFSVVWEGDVVVNAGGELQVRVAFIPENADLYQATLNIVSDDPDEELVQVELLGIGVNDAPEVVNPISDVEVEEDWGRYEIARLNDVFSDPNGDSLSFSVSGSDALNLDISGSDLLYMDPDDDYNGANLEVTVTADDSRGGLRVLRLALIHPNPARVRRLPESERVLRSVNPSETRIDHPSRDETAQDEFLVTITAINDAPICVDNQGNPLGAALDFNVNEDEELQFILYSRDVDDDANDLAWTMVQRGGLPNGYQFTDNGNGTATFTWQPDYNAGRDNPYTPVFRVTDVARASDAVTVNIQVANVNRPPMATEPIEDLHVNEDPAPAQVIIADLDDVFNDPDVGDDAGLQFAFEGAEEALNMSLDAEHRLTIAPAENYFTPRPLTITVTATDRLGSTGTDEFELSVVAVNDPPAAFNLSSPADGTDLTREEYEVRFQWEAATDADGDTVRYDLLMQVAVQERDTVVSLAEDLRGQEGIIRMDNALLALGLRTDDPAARKTITWWVQAGDGAAVTASLERWELDVPLPLGVGADESLPTEFSLGPVYPNPFNAEVRIPYTLPHSSWVQLTIYEHSGRTLQQLVSGIQPAGRYTAVWNAGNYPAGVYIVTLQTEIGRWDVKAVLSR